MVYNLAKPAELDKAAAYLSRLAAQHKRVEITEKKLGRSLSQNAFFHLLATAFSNETAYTPAETKELIKLYVCPDIFRYDKVVNGRAIRLTRSSADLDVQEMTQVIERFMKWSAENGIELPQVDNEDFQSLVLNEAEQLSKHY